MFKNGFQIWSRWAWEHWRKKVSSATFGEWQLINKWEDGNICTDEGLTHLLNVHFYGEDPITAWYLCLFDVDYTPLITDTYATPGYTECDELQDATRPQFQAAEATAKSITNVSNKASFTFALNKTVYGGSLVGGGASPSTIADTAGAGVLFCASKFAAGSQAFIANDVAKLTVSISVASG